MFGWGGNHGGEATGFKTEYPYKTNGQVRIAGQFLRNVSVISAGGGYSLGLMSNGMAAAWGKGLAENERSQMTYHPT